jgi:hypothetical protein
MRWAVAALTLLLSCGVTNAQQIFDESFRRMQSYPVPPYVVFTATWHIRATPMGYYTGEQKSVEVHRYAIRLADGIENISDPGTNGKLPPAIIEPQFLGPFAWRLRSSVHVPPPVGDTSQAPMMAPDIAGLKTIATVVAVAKPSYTIGTNAGGLPPIENVEGREAYHLQLHPRDEPEKHNLRDLWVDTQTFDLVKAHFVGTYRPVPQAPLSPTEVTVYFREVVSCWVVTHAIWTYDNPPMSYTFDLTYNEIGLPSTLPDWLFDDAAYKQHEAAGEPDYLASVLDRLRNGAAPPTR